MAEQDSKVDPAQEKNAGNHPTLFHEILNGDLPAQEKTFQRLKDEAVSVLGAGLHFLLRRSEYMLNQIGTETVAWTLSVAICYILSDPTVHSKLREILAPIFKERNGKPTWNELEKVPYLSAVISEALRLGYGVCGPLPRIATGEALIFKDWIIPVGVSIKSPSAPLMLTYNIDTCQHDFCSHAPESRHFPQSNGIQT